MGLREIREHRGLTQVQLAKLAGLSQPVIASLERLKDCNPKWSTVVRISYALATHPEEIFGIPLEFQTTKNGHRKRPRRARK